MKHFKCIFCKVSFTTFGGLTRHIVRTHKIPTKKYYDTYLKKKGEGICPVCGKKTSFINCSVGYHKHCSLKCSNSDIETIKKSRKTTFKHLGVYNAAQSAEVQKKIRINSRKKHGVNHPNQVESKKRKTFNTKKERYGDGNYNNRKKAFKTMEDKFGVYSYNKTEEFKKKISRIQRANAKTRMIKTRKTNNKKYGTDYPAQNPVIYKKCIVGRKQPKSEKYFQKLLKKKGLDFKKEYYIKNKVWQHHFDFAIFKNGKLKCLVEIDGEYYHGLCGDCDGYHVMGYNDYLRRYLIPNSVKFLVIDSKRLDEGFEELLRILPMKYKYWKKEILSSIPKNIENAIPKFDKNRMLYDWKRLCKYSVIYKHSFIGKSILLNFCKSRIIEDIGSEWKSLRKTLYKSPCSSHHLLEGFDIFKNPSKLREKFRKKYKGVKEVIVKHHSPENMLAICSLGKTYISKEPIDKESKRIIRFLNLKAYEEI
jgi:hypothetical protein